MSRLRIADRYTLMVVGAVLVAIGPLVGEQLGRPELRTSLTLGAAAAISVVGFDLVFGLTRQLHLGQSFFMATGAYTSGVLATRYGVQPLLAIATAVAVSVVLANGLGRILLRLREFHFAAASFALGLLGLNVIVNLREITGADDGVPVDPISLGSWTLTKPREMYTVAVLVALAAVALARNYRRSPRGAAARAVGLDEGAAAAQGLDCVAVKVEVFTLSAGFAALGGALYAHLASYVFISQFGLLTNIEAVAMVVLGGSGTVLGPFLAAFGYEALPDLVSVFEEYPDLAAGVLLIVLLLASDRVRQLRSQPRPAVEPAREGAHVVEDVEVLS
jgi:branched-chain amino acid transport system permease protein